MAYEFGQVEGDIEALNERDLGNVMPDGVSFSQFKEKLDSGEFALLTDTPMRPAMVHDNTNKLWSLSPDTETTLSPQARSALMARANQSGAAAGGGSGSGGGSRPQATTENIEDTYVPEPVKPDRSNEPPPLKYEYCFEIASSDKVFSKTVGCKFQLAKTQQEGVKDDWQTARTEHGTKYTTYTAFNEPKKLIAKIASASMGISVPEPVQVKPIGSGIIQEAFIPVTPSVQLGERLGLPTEGYYYHFYQKRLVQEYKLLGDGKWQFYATRSKHDRLNQAQGFNRYQSAILVYWKIGGKEVEDQHLVYLKAPLTRDLLDNLDDEWLEENGIKLSINELLAAPKQAIAKRDEPSSEKETDKRDESKQPTTHTVKTDPATRQRESWPAIAEQYGLSAKQLLDLNPQYDADPMSLKAGDTLTVKQVEAQQVSSEVATELPPLSPCTYSCAPNTHYEHSDAFIASTPFKAINKDRLLEKELPVANLTTITTVAKATDYGKAAILTLPASGAATNLGVISTNTAKTVGSWSLSGEALAGFGRMGGFLIAALWPSQLGDGTLDGHSELSGVDAITMRVRFNMYTDENGKQQVVGIKTGEGSPYGERVTKREARQSGQNFVAELDDGITITWTPDGSTDVLTPDTVLPENHQLDVHNIWVRPIEEHEQELGTPLYPEEDLAEYLVTFPADAGLPPLYLVFRKTARDESGVVTGNGEDITGRWLEKASEDLGAPIPSQIADKLRGKEFSSFDAFRKAFWTEVASEEQLLSQFSKQNQARMKLGKAPKTRSRDKVGKRNSFELHHVVVVKKNWPPVYS
ncbi:T6SS effector antibacterial DNase [Salinivibrio sp. IB282]|uniref:T6SS effector antibacterial DNase n=1 Tax=Salinivibrio sp. IB282 TaxID=1766122 RepID=UPI00098871BD|nr:S-type pyocin domain-containing protein [Salinivibrio sp. IB282]OOE58101.1 S-type Pyocin domain-containing protein [Salinivibrio sp. IB282]